MAGIPDISEVAPGPSDHAVAEALKRESDQEFRIDPAGSASTHQIVGRLEQLYAVGEADKFGMLATSRGDREVLRVSRSALPRALVIISLLCQACRARGWPVRLTDGRRAVDRTERSMRPLVISVLGHQVDVTLAEKAERRLPAPAPQSRRDRVTRAYVDLIRRDPYEYHPTGLLKLEASPRCPEGVIADRDDGAIETRLNHFCRGMIRAAVACRDRKTRELEALLAGEVARREEEEQEHLRQFQAQLVEEIEAQAGQWAKHQQLSAYLAAVREAYAGEAHLMAADQPLGRWLAWADKHAAQLDPRRHRKLDPEHPPPVVRQPKPYRW